MKKCIPRALVLAALFGPAVPANAQLGPMNWTEPIKVEANNIFLLWHDHQNIGDQTHQKIYDFNFFDSSLPVAERIDATPRREDGRSGNAKYTDVANGRFIRSPREHPVSVWGAAGGKIHIMVPRLDTSAMVWTTHAQDSIVGNVQDDLFYVKTADLDGDSLDEFIVAYLDLTDSIHFALYNVDSLLRPTLTGNYAFKKAIPGNSQHNVRYYIETGDFNGDGTDEIALLYVRASAGTTGDLHLLIYDEVAGALVQMSESIIRNFDLDFDINFGWPAFEISAVAGNYSPAAGQELAVVFAYYGYNAGSFYYNYIHLIDLVEDFAVEELDYFGFQPLPGALNLSTASGDIMASDPIPDLDDGLDEFIWTHGHYIYRMTTANGQLQIHLNIPGQTNATGFGDQTYRSMHNFVKISDVNQDGRKDILAVYDLVSNGTPPGFLVKVWSIDPVNNPTNVVTLIGELYNDEFVPSPGIYGYRPYSIAVGNYDGMNFTIGEPTHSTSYGIVQPIVLLNAPPIHFDQLNGDLYDLNDCYNGASCDFESLYRKVNSSSVEVSTTVQANYETSAGISISGDVSTSAEPLGVGVSISQSYDYHILATYGAHFTNTSTASTTLTIGVEVTAKEDDRIYSTVTDYDLWEYPVFHGNETTPRNTILTMVPLSVQATWFGSKSHNAVRFVPDHEVGHVLSYKPYANLTQNPNLGQVIAADYANDSYSIDGSSNYNWFLGMTDFLSSSADTSRELGVDIGAQYNVFRFDGDYSTKRILTHTVAVTNQIDLGVHLGNVSTLFGDAKYTVTPYAYWDTRGSLVLDYAAKPEIAQAGFPNTWWQDEYGQEPDPTFVLPWRLDPEKGQSIPEEKRKQTKDIIFTPSDPYAGDTITITARVRNFSLLATTQPVTVSFYLGDPENGGTPLIGVTGTNTMSTPGPILDRSRTDVDLRWVIPSNLVNFPRIYAVLDEGNLIAEIHENNNTGFNVLGASQGGVGVEELAMTAPALAACFPNPFESTTTINYVIPNSERTTIQVMDQMGRVVATLVDRFHAAGTYTLQFDGSGLASGMYYCTLRAGSYQESRKMMIAR